MWSQAAAIHPNHYREIVRRPEIRKNPVPARFVSIDEWAAFLRHRGVFVRRESQLFGLHDVDIEVIGGGAKLA